MSFQKRMAVGMQGIPNTYITTGFTGADINQARCVWMDDFIGDGYSTTVWTKAGAGTIICSKPRINGLLKLSTGAVLNQDVTCSTGGICTLGSTRAIDLEFGGIFTTAESDVLIRIGLYYAANKYCYMEIDTATRGNSHWWIVNYDDSGGGEVATDTNIHSDTTGNSPQNFRFVRTSAGVEVYYKVQDAVSYKSSYTLLGTITTKIYSASSLGIYFYIKSLAGTDRSVYIDYVTFSEYRQPV